MENKKFYEKSWFMWVMLFYFAPLGIFLLSRHNGFTKNKKIILSIVSSILFISMFAGAMMGNSSNVSTQNNAITKTSSKPSIAPTAIPTKRADVYTTMDEYIKSCVKETLGEQTNMKKTVLISISNNNNDIIVTFNANENFTNNMMKSGILMDDLKLLKNIYTKDKSFYSQINKISLHANADLTDAYGNINNANVLKIMLDKNTISKINFENFNYENFEMIANEFWVHPAFYK